MKSKVLSAAAALAVMGTGIAPAPAHAGNDPFIGEMVMVGFNFCPRGWAEANGQLLAISSHTALFSLLGTIYGGDGRTTFALPDMRGRVAIGEGTGPGLTNRPLGSRSGSEETTLNSLNMPAHNHEAGAGIPVGTLNDSAAAEANARNNNLALALADTELGTSNLSIDVELNGANQPFNNMQPYTTVTWCIALVGTFPSRS